MSRFDYVKYDEEAEKIQLALKGFTMQLEEAVGVLIKCPRSKALVATKLEEAYMWMGKGVRNDLIERTGTVALQEERTNS